MAEVLGEEAEGGGEVGHKEEEKEEGEEWNCGWEGGWVGGKEEKGLCVPFSLAAYLLFAFLFFFFVSLAARHVLRAREGAWSCACCFTLPAGSQGDGGRKEV